MTATFREDRSVIEDVSVWGERLGELEVLMDPRELARLAELAARVPAHQAIVELGSYRGGSASWMASGAAAGYGAHVTCIDPWPQPLKGWPDKDHVERQRGALAAFTATMQRQEWPVTALRARSIEIAPMWIQPVGLLFIDGDHAYDAVAADYRAWEHLVAAGGWLAFHDYFDDGELAIEGDTARVIRDVVLASGSWAHAELVQKLWVARRVA